jgi:uncharacterized repeat protein (TIGR01451 family)
MFRVSVVSSILRTIGVACAGSTEARQRPRTPRQWVFAKRSWLPTVVIVVLAGAGGVAQSGQQQGDRSSTPAEGTPGPAAQPRPQWIAAAAPQEEAAPQEGAPEAPMIGGIVTVGLNIEASRLFGDSGFIPPDTTGAVGPRHIVEFINGNFEVINKTTGASIESRSLQNFWNTKVGVSGNGTIFDPKIVFDPSSGRWFATSEDGAVDADNDGVNEVSNNFFIARTDTDDPTGDWDGIVVVADTVGVIEFHDYPQVGLDADGLYICTQDFGAGGAESCYSIPKADLLLAAPTAANLTRFESTPPATSGSWQPSVNFGLSIGHEPLIGSTGGALQRIDIFGATAAGATLGPLAAVAGDPGHAAPPAARQPDDSDAGDGIETIENVAPRFVANSVVVGGSIWAVHAVLGSGANSALRWYEINEATNTVMQTGLINNVNVDFHEPSIAVNEFGHVVIGYTCSGPNQAASVCVSVGTTTAGVTTFQPPAIVFAGSGTYYRDFCTPTVADPCSERNRWGDYSATVRDPSDPATFWVFQEYTAQDAGNIDVGAGEMEGGLWGLRVVELTFNELTGGDLAIAKSCQPNTGLLAGQTGSCDISVTNFGPHSVLNVTMLDQITSNGTFMLSGVTTTKGSCVVTPNPQVNSGSVTCSLGRLAANQTVVIHVNVTANTEQTINDVAQVTTDSVDPDPSNNEANGTLNFAGVADLGIIKSDSPDPVVAGTNLTYNITIMNSGPSTAVNVRASDLLSASLTIVSVSASGGGNCNAGIPGSVPTECTFSSLASGASRTMTIVARVDPSVPAGAVLSNNASVTSDTADTNNLNNLAMTTTTVITSADVTIAKADAPDPVIAGANLTYVLSVANLGPSWARSVAVSDTLPLEVTFVGAAVGGGPGTCSPLAGPPTVVQCTLGDIADGASRTITIQTQVSASVPNGTLINNTAAVSSPTPDPVPGNNAATQQTTVNTQADLWIDKTGVQLTGNPSRTIRFTLNVFNKPGCEADDALSCGTGGPSDAQNVVVTDTLPLDPKKVKVVTVSQNCTYNQAAHNVVCTVAGALPAGQFATFTIDIQVAGSVGSIINTASVTSSTADPNPANNTDSLQMVIKGGTSHP